MKYTNKIQSIVDKLDFIKTDIIDDINELEDKQDEHDPDSSIYDKLQDKIDELLEELDAITDAIDELNNILPL